MFLVKNIDQHRKEQSKNRSKKRSERFFDFLDLGLNVADPIEFSDLHWNFSDLRWNSQIYVEFLNILLIWYVSLCCSMCLNVFVALCFNVCWWLNGFRCLFFFLLEMFIMFFNIVQYVSMWFYGLMLSVGFNDFWWSQMVLDWCTCCFWICLMIV